MGAVVDMDTQVESLERATLDYWNLSMQYNSEVGNLTVETALITLFRIKTRTGSHRPLVKCVEHMQQLIVEGTE